jgi:hypothetical protein
VTTKLRSTKKILVIITTYENRENLALKMLFTKSLAQLIERRMRKSGRKGSSRRSFLPLEEKQG